MLNSRTAFREKAAKALGGVERADAIAPLCEALLDEDSLVCYEPVRSLQHYCSWETFATHLSKALTQNPWLRQNLFVADLLCRNGSSQAIQLLVDCFNVGNAHAAYALKTLCWQPQDIDGTLRFHLLTGNYKAAADLGPVSYDALLADRSREAAQALASAPDILEFLRQKLSSGTGNLERAIYIAGLLKNRAAVVTETRSGLKMQEFRPVPRQNLIRSKNISISNYFPSGTFECGARREPRIHPKSGQITPAASAYIKDASIRPSFRRTFS